MRRTVRTAVEKKKGEPIYPYMTTRAFSKIAILILVLLLTLSAMQSAGAQVTTVLKGRPIIRISEGGTERVPESLSRETAVNLECVISRIGENYYRASRENKPMIRIEAGAFITFVSVDGAGYVRMIAPGEKKAVSLMGDTEAKFDYVEHLLIGLKSVTYYGTLR